MMSFSLCRALLLFLVVKILVDTAQCRMQSKKQRHKREWVPPAKKLMENVDYTKEHVAQLGSDLAVKLRFTLKGKGATEPPYNLFVVEEYTGKVWVTDILDRENIDKYNLVAVGWYANNTIAENDIQLPFEVSDQNDNPPVFIEPQAARIYEGSPAGTFVTQVNATDADLPNSLHTKIVYGITEQEPKGTQFFSIDKDSGHITVRDSSLDRESHASYILTVKATDMGGALGGNTATTRVQIHVLDVNDNVPTLEKDEYDVSVDENVADIEVLRVKTFDKDEERTDNWLAEFELVSGNEDGYFKILTDPKTNEGILYLVKPIDFESVSDLNLGVAVKNKAPEGAPVSLGGSGGGPAAGAGAGGGPAAGAGAGGGPAAGAGAGGGSGPGTGAGGGSRPGTGAGGGSRPGTGAGGGSGAGTGAGGGSGAGTGAGGAGVAGRPGVAFPGGTLIQINRKVYSLKVKVNNRPDGPKYGPNPKRVPVSENSKGNSVPRVIAKYPAQDGDTGRQAEKVSYAKGYDPANWISIDENTAEIKLIKTPDRESPYVTNGTYYAKILCMTDDMPSQTATGTIALQVEDSNDNCPTLLSTPQLVCSDVLSVNVTAEDADAHPNGAPLQFLVIPEGTRGKWRVKRTSDVAAVLLPEESLWPGSYKVTMEIKDQQGLACPDKQVLQLEVCTCSNEGTCSFYNPRVADTAAAKTAASASFGASGVGFLLLGILILLLVPVLLLSCSCGGSAGGIGHPKYFADLPFGTKESLIYYHTEGPGEDREVPLLSIPVSALMSQKANVQATKALNFSANAPAGCYGYSLTDTKETIYNASGEDNSHCLMDSDMALSDEFLGRYFTQKAMLDAENATLKDGLLVYDYEGKGSSAGSVSCDSLLESIDDLEFLNDLGTKFAPLAQVCGFTSPELEPVVSKAIPERKVSFDMTTQITCESSMDVESSSHVMKSEIIAEPPPAAPLVSENTSIQSPVLMVKEPVYYMVEQAPSTVLLARQPSVGLGQGMYLVNGMAEAERLILNQSYCAEGNSNERVFSGDSEKSITINSKPPLLHQRSLGRMHSRSFCGDFRPEAVVVTNSVVDQTPIINNGQILKGEHVVFMENAMGPGHMVLGEVVNGLNQNVIQNFSPTQNYVMVQDQVSPTALKPERIGTMQMGLQQVNHGEGVMNMISLVESPGQVLEGIQAAPAELTNVKMSTLQRAVGGIHYREGVLGTHEQNRTAFGQGPGQVQVGSQVHVNEVLYSLQNQTP